MEELFNICIYNPLKTWWKARKYFKMPKPEVHFFKDIHNNCPFARYDYAGKILTIYSMDIMWKDKWNSPRHEGSPYIYVCFFRKFGFSINFHIYYYEETGKLRNGDMEYWEYLLDYLYYRKNINAIDAWSYDSKVYKTNNKPVRMILQTPLFSLNKKGLKEYSKKYT